MPCNNELVLKPISELLNESFFIPAYQRGYRWTKRQVTELLDDIKEFQKQSEEGPKSAFYCLQPIVVKKLDDEWELVDGQQRLTTIYIILSYLKEIAALLGKSRYKMRYETRHNSAFFLENIDDSLRNENIDYFHISEAKQAIHEWFSVLDGTYKLKFLQTLLNDDETGKNVKVIWYQINEDADATAVFTRLNVGKIPLTNAELVKALFLKSGNFEKEAKHLHQIKIANEWDDIERTLQNDEFWFFANNDLIEANRIEFVLGLVAGQLPGCEEVSPRDPFYIFLQFNHQLAMTYDAIDDEWHRIKQCFMTLKEWFNDRKLFHICGYLISQNVSVRALLERFMECSTKQEFRQKLANVAFEKAFPYLDELDDYQDKASLKLSIEENLTRLSYDSDRRQIVAILLLFNITSLLANPQTNARFQFNRYKQESWDIEHIRSVASHMPESKDKQRLWLVGVVDFISSGTLNSHLDCDGVSDIENIKNIAGNIINGKTFDSNAFEDVFLKVLKLYDPDGDEDSDNSIGNLTLLDSSTNRSYQNAIFPIKRNRIISLDRSATFVPLCTKNVFLKYYSKHVNNMMFWQTEDSIGHQKAMIEMLTDFFAINGAIR